jgi:hypothetical protein
MTRLPATPVFSFSDLFILPSPSCGFNSVSWPLQYFSRGTQGTGGTANIDTVVSVPPSFFAEGTWGTGFIYAGNTILDIYAIL